MTEFFLHPAEENKMKIKTKLEIPFICKQLLISSTIIGPFYQDGTNLVLIPDFTELNAVILLTVRKADNFHNMKKIPHSANQSAGTGRDPSLPSGSKSNNYRSENFLYSFIFCNL